MTTLTLDEVRNTKFHMARRAGYEVTDVDLFVDRVEASFAKLVEENEMLRRQVDALQQAAKAAEEAQQVTGSLPPVAIEPPAPVPQPSPVQPPVSQYDQPIPGGDQHIVVTTSSEASPAVVRLVQMATEQAERLVNEAEAEAHATVESADQQAQVTIDQANRQASQTIDQANRQAADTVENANRESHQTITDAQTRADRIQSEARVNAERVTSDAQGRADNLDNEVKMRRAELFSGLEDERDQLQKNVGQLRDYESSFRRKFSDLIRQQLGSLESAQLEPESRPALVNDLDSKRPTSIGRSASSTPRLDALMGDHR